MASSLIAAARHADWNALLTTPGLLIRKRNEDGVANPGRLQFGNSTAATGSPKLTIEATAPAGEGEGEGEPSLVITSNVYPPYIDEGTIVILTSPLSSAGYQWAKNGTDIQDATDRELVFEPVTEENAGSYTVTYDNGAKAVVTTPAFNLTISARRERCR